ncbi:MAG: transcriptional repressor LexA [Clostridiales bacterium]|nr:transcriptional repressor LexA [Clostridiales bacterium]
MSHTRGDSQAKILEYIQRSIKEVGYPPSVRDICNATGLKSTSTVHGHLLRLQKKGLLNRDAMKPRAISVPMSHDRDMEMMSVPVVGCVTAGSPILAQENIEDYIPLPQSLLVGDGEYYALRVRGDSMIEAGILSGDYVVVKKQPIANNGEIVVAMIGDEATVKRYYRENGMFRLQPENRSMQPIFTAELTILGKVVSMYRMYSH